MARRRCGGQGGSEGRSGRPSCETKAGLTWIFLLKAKHGEMSFFEAALGIDHTGKEGSRDLRRRKRGQRGVLMMVLGEVWTSVRGGQVEIEIEIQQGERRSPAGPGSGTDWLSEPSPRLPRYSEIKSSSTRLNFTALRAW